MQQRQKAGPASESGLNVSEIDQSFQRLRADNQKFIDGFSSVQKSGLKDNLKKLAKADSDLETEAKRLDESLQAGAKGSIELGLRSESLNRSLADFSNQELDLGKGNGPDSCRWLRPDIHTRGRQKSR